MKVTTSKTKVMWMGSGLEQEGSGKFPCAVCKKGVGSNSILCVKCEKWTHKRCSGVKGSLVKIQDFICSRCKKDDGPTTVSTGLEIEKDEVFGRVGTFC